MSKKFLMMVFIAIFSVISVMASKNISGAWSGTLRITPQLSLKLVFNFKTEEDGIQLVTLDSPDQGAYGIAGDVNFISADSVNISFRQIGLSFAGRQQNGIITGICSQGAMKANIELSPGTVELKRPQTPLPPYPYTTKEININNPSDDVILSGTLTLPKDYNTATPVVVMITGSGLQNRDEEIFGHKPFAVIADYLARNGIASFRYDEIGRAHV